MVQPPPYHHLDAACALFRLPVFHLPPHRGASQRPALKDLELSPRIQTLKNTPPPTNRPVPQTFLRIILPSVAIYLPPHADRDLPGPEDATATKAIVKGNEFLSGTMSIFDAIPTRMDETVFNSLYLSVFAAFGLAAVGYGKFATKPYEMAFLLGFGPPLIGLVVLFAFGDKKSLLWPFHKEPIFGALGFHTVFAFFMVILPVYHFGTTVLAPAGEAPYFKIFGADPTQA